MNRLPAARWAPAALIGIVMLLVAGGGYALASGGNSITLCVNRHGGGVYKAKKCHQRDSKLTFSKTGPAGPKGATGAHGTPGTPGTPGAPGTTGPSDGYADMGADQSISATETTLATLSLPPGRYILDATDSMVDHTDTTTEGVRCDLLAPPSTTPITSGYGETNPPIDDGSIAVTAALTLTTAGTVNLSCLDGGSENMDIFNPNLTAILVGSLNGSVQGAGATGHSSPPR